MKNPAISNGVYLGIVSVIFSLLVYFLKVDLLFSFWMLPIGILIWVFFMRRGALEERENNGGTLSYGEALKTIMIIVVIGTLIGTLWNYVLFNFIDPGLVDMQREAALNNGIKMAEAFGADEAALEQVRESMEEQDFSVTPWNALKGWLGSIVMGGIIGLIVSAFVKRNPQA